MVTHDIHLSTLYFKLIETERLEITFTLKPIGLTLGETAVTVSYESDGIISDRIKISDRYIITVFVDYDNPKTKIENIVESMIQL